MVDVARSNRSTEGATLLHVLLLLLVGAVSSYVAIHIASHSRSDRSSYTRN